MNTPLNYKQWAVFALGLFFILFGLPMVIGGMRLILLGGSWYYLPAGIAFIVSGWQLIKRKRLGATIYAALFITTILWSLVEVGLNGWALVPRIFGLSILLLLIVAALPVLLPARSMHRFRVLGLSSFATVVIVLGMLLVSAGSPTMNSAEASAWLAAKVPTDTPLDKDWSAYGGDYHAQRFSSLTQVNRDNVEQLERVWEFRTGDLPSLRWGAETTPLKIDDSVYLCSARNILIALNARTGKERWRYDPKIADDAIPYTAACRGVAYYAKPGTQACAKRVIEGTLDARLIAVDAITGLPCSDFGDNGNVNTTRGMGKMAAGMVSITSPPTIVRGIIVVSHQILDGERRDAPSSVIQGFDAVTSELRWAWDLARPDLSERPPQGQTYTRGTANMWTIASGDEQLGLVYLPMGNSAADYNRRSRSVLENQYSSAQVALDVTTGKPVWHFQTVHRDVWDYDLGSQATLVDFPTPTGVVPALVLPSKQGEIYILDRRTGAPLTGVEERLVPVGGVEPEQRTATQPFSLYHTLRKTDITEKDMWGMSPIDQMLCRIQFRQATYNGVYTPPTTDSHWIQYPGYNGGSDWGGVSVDPQRVIIIANYNDMPNYNRLVPREEAEQLGWFPRDDPRQPIGNSKDEGAAQIGVPYAVDVNAGWRMPYTGLLCKQPPWGGIRAIDLASGKTLWDRPLGTARANGPFGIPSMLPVEIGTPNNGCSVITAGGQATPMVYAIEGRQYIVIVAAGHHFMETPIGDYMIAYALPEVH